MEATIQAPNTVSEAAVLQVQTLSSKRRGLISL
jgi:hypothetical protein